MSLRILGPLLVAAGLATFFGVQALLAEDRGDGWETYRNEKYGYQFRYPPDWFLEAGAGQVNEGIEIQYTSVTRGDDRVLIGVNFQGGWCEFVGPATGKQEVVDILVSGTPGKEYVCYAADGDFQPDSVVRHFEEVRSQRNYVVFSEPQGEVATVRKIIESFQFLD